MSDAKYINTLKKDKIQSQEYYLKSIHKKTEQQKFFEKLIHDLNPLSVADIACGGGGGSFHLQKMFPNATFDLVDLNQDAIEIAQKMVLGSKTHLASTYEIPLIENSIDLVVCFHSLFMIENPEKAINELIRICKPGGRIFVSSLFNFDHDCDLSTAIYDHTREEGGSSFTYNTYSERTISAWLPSDLSLFKIHRFDMSIDIDHRPKGIGTYTKRLESGERLEISGGVLMNWGFLEIRK